MSRGLSAAVAVLSLAGAAGAIAAGASAAETELVSVGLHGQPANGTTRGVSISTSGRYVAFGSRASNLVAGDRNRHSDVFVLDRKRHRTTRISIGRRGAEANGPSFNPSISGDGRIVGFESSASNLVAGDDNDKRDVFAYDRSAGKLVRVSVSDKEREGNDKSLGVAVSANGKLVAFNSFASNLVAGGGRAHHTNIFVRDLARERTTLVSVGLDGEPTRFNYGPSISADGRLVAFESAAANLVTGDTNGDPDIFLRNLPARTTTRASVSASGQQAGAPDGFSYSQVGSLSADGRFVAFESVADNLIDGVVSPSGIFVKDLVSGAVTRLPADVGGQAVDAARPRISADGSRVAFQTNDPLLVPDNPPNDADPHVFVYDRGTGVTTRVDTAAGGGRVGNYAASPRISGDGRFVAFVSPAKNLVPNDDNRVADAFVTGPLP